MRNKLKNYRQQLKEKGLIKKEVWVRPENVTQLKLYEHRLRKKGQDIMEQNPTSRGSAWTPRTLCEALGMTDESREGIFSLQVDPNSLDPALIVTMQDYEEFPIYLSISGEQILAMVFLCSIHQVEDSETLNENLLRVNSVVPLSSFGIVGNDYVLFGSLSVESKIQSVVTELVTLAENTVEALEIFSNYT